MRGLRRLVAFRVNGSRHAQARRWIWVPAALAFLCLLTAVPGSGSTPAGYSEYIIPFDEDIFVHVTDPLTNSIVNPIPGNYTTASIISLTVWADDTTVYVDHWEDGYEFDPDNPDTYADEKYTANLGETLNFQSDPIPRPRTGADGNTYIGSPAGDCTGQAPPKAALIRTTLNYCYDGRDYIYAAGGATTMTRGGWINSPFPPPDLGPRAAIGEEVYPLAPQLIKYILPFGEDATRSSYERVLAVIQATEDNTDLRIDFDADGTFDSFNTENGYRTTRVDPVDAAVLTLQRGETYILDRDSDGIGGTLDKDVLILGTKTLQVEYFYGEANSSPYDTRAVAAYPRGFWGRDYYASVDGAPFGADTDILVYNPDTTQTITIDWQNTAGTGSFTLAPTERALFQAKTGAYVPEGSGVYLSSSNTFWGFSDIDVNSGNYDWGYSLVPSYLLQDEQAVSYAPGNAPILACNAGEGRDGGIFVTPSQDNTTFFIDKDGDDIPDTDASIEVLRGVTPVTATGSGGYLANRLDSLYITGSNSGNLASSPCDLTGARIWATGPFTMAYGENPQKSTAAGGLDLGYTVLPNPGDWMDLVLTLDKTTNPVVLSTVAGATTVTYTLVVGSHEFEVDSLSVVDTLPANWEYISGTTTITLPDLTQISTDPTVSLPALTWDSSVLGSLLPNQTVTITFNARTTAAFSNGDLTRNRVEAAGTRTVGGVTQTFRTRDFVFNTYADSTVDMTIGKASSVPEAIPVSPNDTLTYTVVVGNPPSSTSSLTNVWISDPLPLGVSYVPGSGQVAGCSGFENVRDEFGSVAYTNNDGSQNWSGAWAETDTLGGGAFSGAVQVTSSALRLTYADGGGFVRDEFNTAGSGSGNDGSVNWATSWDKSEAGDNFAAGDIRILNGYLEFQDTTDGGEWVQRSATVAGATIVTVDYDWDESGSGGEGVIVEWSLTGVAGWTTLRTLDFGDPDGPFTDVINPWNPANTTIYLRFRAFGNYDGGDQARFDNVQVSYNGTAGGPAANDRASRTADLSSATSATLSFSSATSGTLDAGDVVQVRVGSTASFASSTLLESVSDDGTFTGSYNISSYMSANTTVFFVVANGVDTSGEWRSFDDVDISYTTTLSPFASGNPPDFLSSSVGCSITPGSAVTLTFDVTVDDPFPTELSEILNTAGTGAAEIPIPLYASALNIVVAPSSGSATVGDRVWLDRDGDGVLDPGETGLAGVEVTLKDQWGTPLQVTMTDSQGRYLFINVEPGNGYFVEVTDDLPAGLTQTTDGRTDLRTNDFDLSSGQDYYLADLGFQASAGTAVIGDLVWVDANADQTRNPGEVGLAGVTVELWEDTDGDGLNDVLIDTQVTGPGGIYLFTGIPADGARDYVVTLNTGQAALAGYTVTTLLTYDYINLPSGDTRVDADFGFQQTSPGTTFTLSDGVWLDNGSGGGTAGDGIKNGSEAGIGGVTVALIDNAGNIIASTTTDSNGDFAFTGVPGGQNYTWRITDDSHVLADLYGTTPEALAGEFQITGSLSSDLDYTASPHFGYNVARAIGDIVWNDIDGDGVQDAGEPGLGAVSVQLYLNDGDAAFEPGGDDGNPVASLVTTAVGFYLFAGLTEGTEYWVSIDGAQSALSGFTSLTTGDDDGSVAGDQRRVTPALSGGASRFDIDYGYRAPTSFELAGRLWNDANNNGSDDTEAGFAGVTMELVRGGVVIATTSAADGSFSFPGLPPDTYTLRFTDVDGVLAGFDTTYEKTEGPLAGSYDGQEVAIIVAADITDLDFGFYRRLPTYAAVAWFDAFVSEGSVVVEWRTSLEVGTVGFYLLRFDTETGKYVRLNERLLPGLLVHPEGGTYRFEDSDAPTWGTLTYVLEEVDVRRRRNRYGPYTVTVADGPIETSQKDWVADRDDISRRPASQNRRRISGRRFERKPLKPSLARRAAVDTAFAESRAARARRRAQRGETLKITTGELGLHYLPASGLAEKMGQSTAAISGMIIHGMLRLTNRGRVVPYLPGREGSGIYFYAELVDSIYTDENAYWIRPGSGATMSVSPSAPGGPLTDSFLHTVHLEEDNYPLLGYLQDPESDFWVWDYLFAGEPGWDTKSLVVSAPHVEDMGDATLAVQLIGGSETAAVDHHIVVSWNGDVVGETSWDGTGHTFEVALYAGDVLEANTLELRATLGPGVPDSIVFFDSVDLTYQRRYRALDDELSFTAAAGTTAAVTGFSSPAVMLLDITAPESPALVTGHTVAATGDGTYEVLLGASGEQGDRILRYLAISSQPERRVANQRRPVASVYRDEVRARQPHYPGLPLANEFRAKAPLDVTASQGSGLLSRRHQGADYLLIAPDSLVESAGSLAEYRNSLGIDTTVVGLEDIYNEFNYGIESPLAIRDFLRDATSRWRMPPRYVTLVGRGTWDYKDIQGFGDNRVPTPLAATPWGLAASDVRLADLSGDDGVPEIALGRLPVVTSQQLLDYVEKVQTHEAAASGPWQRRVLMTADNADAAGSFPADSDWVAALIPPDHEVDRIYLGTLDAATARQAIIDALNQGTMLFNYIGHGGLDHFAEENLFASTSVASLTNADRLPVLLAMTCATGNFAIPGFPSLSERLLLHEGGGAYAAWSPSGLSTNQVAVNLDAAFFQAAFVDGQKAIGDAIVRSLTDVQVTGSTEFMRYIYNLLGEPVSRLPY